MTPTLAATLFAAVTMLGAGQDAAPLLDEVERKGGDLAGRDPLPSLVLIGTMSAAGFADDVPVEEFYLGADHARKTVSYPEFGVSVIGRQGDVCYSRDPAVGITVREGQDAAGVRRFLAISRRAPWRSIYRRAEHFGVEDVDGRSLTKVLVLPSATTADSSGDTGDMWWIDAEAGRLVHVDLKLPNPQGGELPCRFTFGDWRFVDGVAYPGTVEQRVGTYLMKTTYTTITPGGAVDPSRVAPPEDVVAAIEDPSRRATVAREAGVFVVEEVEEKHVLSIREEVPAEHVSFSLASFLPEVLDVVTKNRAEVASPPFSRYHNFATAGGPAGEGTLDLEAGIPLREAFTGALGDRVKASTLPAGRVVTGWHVGQYHDLPKTYERLQAWMKAEGLEPTGGPWEVYWTDPGLEPDPAKWRTQVFWPVK